MLKSCTTCVTHNFVLTAFFNHFHYFITIKLINDIPTYEIISLLSLIKKFKIMHIQQCLGKKIILMICKIHQTN